MNVRRLRVEGRRLYWIDVGVSGGQVVPQRDLSQSGPRGTGKRARKEEMEIMTSARKVVPGLQAVKRRKEGKKLEKSNKDRNTKGGGGMECRRGS